MKEIIPEFFLITPFPNLLPKAKNRGRIRLARLAVLHCIRRSQGFNKLNLCFFKDWIL